MRRHLHAVDSKERNLVQPSTRPFRDALIELVLDSEFVTATGSPNLAAFARSLDGVHYETLRKVLSGERALSREVVSECARVLNVTPDHFLEWRSWDVMDAVDPQVVGFDQAAKNLEQFSAARTEAKKRKRR